MKGLVHENGYDPGVPSMRGVEMEQRQRMDMRALLLQYNRVLS